MNDLLKQLVAALTRLRDLLVFKQAQNTPPQAPTSPVEPSFPPEVPKIPPTTTVPVIRSSMLTVFCTAIRDFEGAPGDLNYRNNNPGNFRCSKAGYLAKYGNVRCVNNFAVFPTYEQGWEYLKASVLHLRDLHPNWTILDFFMYYAPPSDNNPTQAYAATIAKKCGVSVNTTLKELLG